MTDQIVELEHELDEISAQINECRIKNETLRKKLTLMQSLSSESPLNDERVHFNDSLVYNEMARRGIALKYIPHTNITEAKYNSHVEFLIHATSRFIPSVDAAILENKFRTKQLLKEKGFPVVDGMIFSAEEIKEAQDYAKKQLGYPVVIKPTAGSGGDYVFCSIQNDVEFRRAFSAISKVVLGTSILVEKHIVYGDDYRFFIIGGKVQSIVKRTPPVIVGDGVSTILQLVEIENFRRMNPRNTCLCPIQIDDWDSERCLQRQSIKRDTILRADESVQCRFNSNVSTGGECETVTNQVHPSYCAIAESVLELFPRLPIFVIDLLIQNSAQEASWGNHWICECCCINPGLSLHTHPSKGKGDDIISPLVDLLFPETATKP